MRAFMMGTAVATVLALGIGAGIAQQPLPSGQLPDHAREHTANRQQVKAVVRASEIIGMDVTNNADEDLGSIEDLAINPNTGKIEYAAVSMGGFLGVGDKLFAVPWHAVECRSEEPGALQSGDEPDHIAVINVDKESLKNAEGFDQDNWPDMASDEWRSQNDQPYQSRRGASGAVR